MSNSNKFDANKVMEDVKKDRNLAAVVVGSLVLVVGLFLPWLSVDTAIIDVSANGFDANGALPLILAVVAAGAALNVMNQAKKTMWLTALIASSVALLMVLIDWPNTSDFPGVSASIGLGYYLSLAGTIAMTVGSAMKYKMMNEAKSATKAKSKSEDKSDE